MAMEKNCRDWLSNLQFMFYVTAVRGIQSSIPILMIMRWCGGDAGNLGYLVLLLTKGTKTLGMNGHALAM